MWSGECEAWNGECKCGVWSGDCEVWSLGCDCAVIARCEVWSLKCGVWSGECALWSEECEVWSGECEVWSGSVEWRVWSVMWEVWSGGREVWSLKFGVWSVECDVGWRSVVWSVKRGVESVKCGVLLQTVCMQLGILFNIPTCREPNFCVVSKRNWSGGLASSPICHLLASLFFSPFFLLMVAWGAHFGLAALVPKLPPMCFYAVCTSPFVLSRLVLVLHTGPHCPQCVSTLTVLLHLCCLHWSWYFTLAPGKGIVSHHLSVSSMRCVFCFPSCGYFGTKVFSSFLSPPPWPPWVSFLSDRSPHLALHLSPFLWRLCDGGIPTSFMFRTISFVVPYGRNATDMSFDCHHWLSHFQYVFWSKIQEARPGGIWIIRVSSTVMDLEVFGFQHYFWPCDTFWHWDGGDGTWWVFCDQIGLVAVQVWWATWASVCFR